jgi:hypothetical protein
MTNECILDMMKHENLIIEIGANYECCRRTIIDWFKWKVGVNPARSRRCERGVLARYH